MGWNDKIEQAREMFNKAQDAAQDKMPWTTRLAEQKMEPIVDKANELKERMEHASAREVIKNDFSKAANATDPGADARQRAEQAQQRLDARKADDPSSQVAQSSESTAAVEPSSQNNPTPPPTGVAPRDVVAEGGIETGVKAGQDFTAASTATEPPPPPPEVIAQANDARNLENASLGEGPKPPAEIEYAVKSDLQAAVDAQVAQTHHFEPTAEPTTSESFNEVAQPSLQNTFNDAAGPKV